MEAAFSDHFLQNATGLPGGSLRSSLKTTSTAPHKDATICTTKAHISRLTVSQRRTRLV